MKKTFGAIFFLTATSFAADGKVPPNSDIEHWGNLLWGGNIQIQGQKFFEKDGWGDNLDQLYGRFNLSSFYSDSTFSSQVQIRAYPAGFGYEPLFGASFHSDTGNTELVTQSSSIAKFQVYRAWVKYVFPYFEGKVGRFGTYGAYSEHFGNYLDQDPGGEFLSRYATHNAAQMTKTQGIFHSNVLLGTNDPNGNRGFIRIEENISHPSGFTLGLGYRGNIFDPIYHDGEDIISRVSVEADYLFGPNLRLYTEGAWIQQSVGKDLMPVLVGVSLPTRGLLDELQIELEYESNRVDLLGEDKPVLFHIYGKRTVFGRARGEAGIFSDPTGPDPQNIGVGFRFTSQIL